MGGIASKALNREANTDRDRHTRCANSATVQGRIEAGVHHFQRQADIGIHQRGHPLVASVGRYVDARPNRLNENDLRQVIDH